MYVGGYDDMVMAKTSVRSRIESENAQREKKIERLQDFIARFGAGTRSAQATSRKKEIERLQTTVLARSNIARPYINFVMKKPSGRHPLEFKTLRKSYGDLKVIDGFSANLERGEKIALLGRNGAGKTTLIRSLIRNAPGFIDEADRHFGVDGGTVRWGHEVAVGYFGQEHTLEKDNDLTVIEWLAQWDPMAGQQELRGLLGQMLFSGDDVTKPIRALSGGETARILFCRLMLQKPNFLVFDEPTNHLDLESINALKYFAAEIRRHGVAGDPRPRRDRRSGHAPVVLRSRPHRRFQGTIRGLFAAAATQGGAGYRATVAACMLSEVSLAGQDEGSLKEQAVIVNFVTSNFAYANKRY